MAPVRIAAEPPFGMLKDGRIRRVVRRRYQIRSLRRTLDSEGSEGLDVPFDPVPL
ncbi:hypothetical protein ABID59_005089 [Bradyrhizobium sp. S3.3.6]